MQRFRGLITATTIAFMVSMACGDSNPAGVNLSSFPAGGADGPNEAVTASNAGTVFSAFAEVFGRVSAAGQSAQGEQMGETRRGPTPPGGP